MRSRSPRIWIYFSNQDLLTGHTNQLLHSWYWMIHGPLQQTWGHPGKEKQIPRTMYLQMWMTLHKSKTIVMPQKAIPVTDGSARCGLTWGWALRPIVWIISFYFALWPTNAQLFPQIITLLHVSTLSCHPQTACNQYLAKLHKYFKCSCW